MSNKVDPMNWVINRAWARDHNNNIIVGEALLLGALMHTQGAGRNSADMKDLQRIMKDVNLDKDK